MITCVGEKSGRDFKAYSQLYVCLECDFFLVMRTKISTSGRVFFNFPRLLKPLIRGKKIQARIYLFTLYSTHTSRGLKKKRGPPKNTQNVEHLSNTCRVSYSGAKQLYVHCMWLISSREKETRSRPHTPHATHATTQRTTRNNDERRKR